MPVAGLATLMSESRIVRAQVTVSEGGGPDARRAWDVPGDPREVAFRESEDNVAAAVSVNVGGRSIRVFQVHGSLHRWGHG